MARVESEHPVRDFRIKQLREQLAAWRASGPRADRRRPMTPAEVAALVELTELVIG